MKRLLVLLFIALALPVFAADPLPSWNTGAAKQSIVDFVAKVTKAGSGARFMGLVHRAAEQGARRGESQRLDGGRDEEGLEASVQF